MKRARQFGVDIAVVRHALELDACVRPDCQRLAERHRPGVVAGLAKNLQFVRTDIADQGRLALEGDQRTTEIALREGCGRATATAVEYRHVGKDARDQGPGRLGAEPALDAGAPGGEPVRSGSWSESLAM